MKRHIFTVVMVSALLLGLSGCGDKTTLPITLKAGDSYRYRISESKDTTLKIDFSSMNIPGANQKNMDITTTERQDITAAIRIESLDAEGRAAAKFVFETLEVSQSMGRWIWAWAPPGLPKPSGRPSQERN